jgi:hypothetical protein
MMGRKNEMTSLLRSKLELGFVPILSHPFNHRKVVFDSGSIVSIPTKQIELVALIGRRDANASPRIQYFPQGDEFVVVELEDVHWWVSSSLQASGHGQVK